MKRNGKSSWLRASVGIFLLCALLFSTDACAGRYNPSLYPSYDVLNPGPEVRANPVGFVAADGRALDEKGQILAAGTVVNDAFLLWVHELKEEVEKLRLELKRKGD